MRAAIFNGPLDLEIREYSLPAVGKNEILLKVESCGICGTDFHIFHGESYAKPPVIIGHEYAGTIVETGKDVKEYNTGDHIAVDPNIYCGECYYCKNGKINFCTNLKASWSKHERRVRRYSLVPVSLISSHSSKRFSISLSPLPNRFRAALGEWIRRNKAR